VPVLYFCMGEKYDDIMPYNPEFVVNNIVGG
jgi:signal recognition particle GTPase